MIHMLSSFDLNTNEDWDTFASDYDNFVNTLQSADIILGSDPLGHRVDDTPMDTDTERKQRCFSVIHFLDRAQLDLAYAHIEANKQPSTATHLRMYRRLSNAVFLCWEDSSADVATNIQIT